MTQLAGYEAAVQTKGFDGATSTELDAAIQAGRRRVADERRWSWLQDTDTSLSTAAGDSTVSLATLTDLGSVDAVRLRSGTTDYPLRPLPYQELRNLQADPILTSTARPWAWSRFNDDLVFYPTPEAAYTLVIERSLVLDDLAADTDDTIPSSLKDLVAWAAVVDLAFRQRDAAAMQLADQQYRSLLRQAIHRENMEQRQAGEQVRSGYWGGSAY